MAGGLHIPKFTIPSPSRVSSEVGDTVRTGLRHISGKMAAFGRFLSQGAANSLRTIGHALSSGRELLADIPRALTGEGYSAREKQALLADAKATPFYQSLGTKEKWLRQADFETCAIDLLQRPAAVKAMKDHKVSLAEAVAIKMYTSEAYEKINGRIRNGANREDINQLREAFTSGLAKLPSFRAKDGTANAVVHRGAKLPEEVGDTYKVGGTIRESGIMSTTHDESQSFKSVNFKIHIALKQDSKGKDISMFSAHPEEREVAFPPGSEFRITRREVYFPYDVDADQMAAVSNRHPTFNGSVCDCPAEVVMEEI